jgi:hypothetical protein
MIVILYSQHPGVGSTTDGIQPLLGEQATATNTATTATTDTTTTPATTNDNSYGSYNIYIYIYSNYGNYRYSNYSYNEWKQRRIRKQRQLQRQIQRLIWNIDTPHSVDLYTFVFIQHSVNFFGTGQSKRVDLNSHSTVIPIIMLDAGWTRREK